MEDGALVFGMELRADEPAQRGNLDDFDKARLRMATHALHTLVSVLLEGVKSSFSDGNNIWKFHAVFDCFDPVRSRISYFRRTDTNCVENSLLSF